MRRRSTTGRSIGLVWRAALLVLVAGSFAAAREPGEPEEGAGQSAPERPEVAVEPEAEAAPTPTLSGEIEEILVIDSQRDALLEDIPISITSFNAAELKSLRVQNIADLAEYTPNLEINTAFAASNPTLFIRGIGLKDYNANAAGAVAVYQDGININSPAIQLFQLFDVKGVDVLRGPQGSLNGRNATAGAIMVNSVIPDGEFGFSSSFSYGNFDNLQAEGAVSLPIWGEYLSARFAGTANFRDGTTDNQCAGWDPQDNGFVDEPGPRGTVNSYVYTADTLLAEYEKDLAANNLPAGDLYTDVAVKRPNRQERLDAAGVDAQAKRLLTDAVCILKPPGKIVTPRGEMNGLGPAGSFKQDNVPQLADFQNLKTKINDVDNWAGRGILRSQPLDGMDWVLNAHGGQNRSDSRHLTMVGGNAKPETLGIDASLEDGFSEASASDALAVRGVEGFEGVKPAPGVDPTPAFPGDAAGRSPFEGWYNRDGTEYLDTWGVSLKGTWDLGPFVVSSVTGYEWYDRFVEDEGDANPLDVFPAFWGDSAEQISTELRVEGEGEIYRWTLGLFYLKENLKSQNEFPDTRQFTIVQTFDQKLKSFAPFFNGRFWFTEELSLEGGVRYSVESKDFTLGTVTSTAGGGDFEEIPSQPETETWRAVTGDVTLSYSPAREWLSKIYNDRLTVYARYARGFKGGHFNAGLTIRSGNVIPSVSPVEPEFIDAVEVGFRSNWFYDRLILNLAGFQYWYKDLQVFDIENAEGELPLQKLLNSDAQVMGAELELQARPLPGLFVQVGGGWLDSQFKDFTVTKSVLNQRGEAFQATFDYDGNPLIAAPTWSLSGVAEYEIPLFGWGFLVPQYDFSYRSRVYLDPQKLEAISQPAYWLHNARLAYRSPDGRIEVAGWVENFMAKKYRIDVFDVTREFNTVLEVWGDPRVYGFTVSYTF